MTLVEKIKAWIDNFVNNIKKAFERVSAGTDTSDFLTYLNTAGEIEAYDVGDRVNYTTEQRKNTRPDIDRTDVVFADSGVSYSIVEPFIDDKGNKYENAVLLDTEFFDGISPRNWGNKLKIYVEERSKNNPIIMPIHDEKGEKQILSFAKESDRTYKNGNNHKVLSELYKTSDNISKLSVIHIDEIVEMSEENIPYFSDDNSHGWLDKNGWLHRNANVINKKNGAIYNLTFDIAKSKDGRTILYTTKGKIKKVGHAAVNSLKFKGSPQKSNFEYSISNPNENVKENPLNSNELIKKYPSLNLNQDISNLDGVPAIRLTDGSVLPLDTFNGRRMLHVEYIQKNKIDFQDIESGGWIGNGEYEPSFTSDTQRYLERMSAKKQVADLTGKSFEQFKQYSLRDNYKNALTSAEWKKYNNAMTSGVDAGLRINGHSLLVECENGEYSYKLVIYDNETEDKLIKSVYAISKSNQPTTNNNFDEKAIAEFITALEDLDYDNKQVLERILKSYSKNVSRVLWRYSGSSNRFIRYGRKVSESGRNSQNQSYRTGIFETDTGTVKFSLRDNYTSTRSQTLTFQLRGYIIIP